MKTNVTDTSIDCFNDLRATRKLSRMQSQIMAAINPGADYTLQELVRLTGLPVNTVSGRCNELRTAKRLEHGKTRACSVTGRKVHPVKLPALQGGLF